MELFLCVIGMVMVVEGLPYFSFPEKMKHLMRIMEQKDDTSLRIMGATLVILGLAIIFFARRGLS
jgi:uncharacterized protein YjeT (DUF2065 family)